MVWNWGGAGGAAGAYTLVYDESDEVALPFAQRSFEWNRRAEKIGETIYATDHVAITHLDGHFYLLTEFE